MPELPGSRAMTVGPSGSARALPLGGELESVAASESQAPDPAFIASIANALFRGLPAEGLAGPGANLPSAPVYGPDALAARSPHVPNAAAPASSNFASGAGPGAEAPAVPILAATRSEAAGPERARTPRRRSLWRLMTSKASKGTPSDAYAFM